MTYDAADDNDDNENNDNDDDNSYDVDPTVKEEACYQCLQLRKIKDKSGQVLEEGINESGAGLCPTWSRALFFHYFLFSSARPTRGESLSGLQQQQGLAGSPVGLGGPYRSTPEILCELLGESQRHSNFSKIP